MNPKANQGYNENTEHAKRCCPCQETSQRKLNELAQLGDGLYGKSETSGPTPSLENKNPSQQDIFLKTRLSLINSLRDWHDHASWEVFFKTYWKLIYSCALKSGLSHGTAQDIVQDTIISVSKNIDHYDRTKSSFKGWLYMIVSSRIIDRLRKKQHRVKCIPLGSETFMQNASGDSTLMQTDNALEALWEKEWKNSLLQIAIERVKKRVNPRQFQMFDLYVNKEWSLTEIQQTTGASESAIRKAKERIMDAIQEEVKFLEKNPPAGF